MSSLGEGFDYITVGVCEGVTLMVNEPTTYSVTGALWAGDYLDGKLIACFICKPHECSVSHGPAMQPDGIWFAGLSIDLPWLELLKVADFLKLDIPLPVPLGEQVPA